MLNDTRLHSQTECHLPGFYMIRSDKNTNDSTSGGSAILLPNNWDAMPNPSLTESQNGFESVGVIAAPPGCKPIKLMCIYNHPQHHIPQHLFNEFSNTTCNNKNIYGFIGGDLNCPHEAFGSRFTNVYGTYLFNFVNAANLYVIDNQEPTTFHRGEPNILDLFLCEPNSIPLVQKCFVGESIGSDHLPLIIHIKLNSSHTNYCRQFTRKIFENEKFIQTLECDLESFDPYCSDVNDADNKLNQLTDILTSSIKKCTKEKTSRHARPYIPPEILSWIKTRKTILKHMRKTNNPLEKQELSTLYNRANKVVKCMLDKHDKEKQAETITKMQNLKQTSQMWSLYKQMKNQLQPESTFKRPLSQPNGEKIFDPDSKAETFAARLENIHQTPKGPLFDQVFEKKVSDFMVENKNTLTHKLSPSDEPDDTHDLMKPITATDVKNKIESSKKSSAPGEDGISYKILAQCPEIFFVKLAFLLNFCMSIGYFPDTWKKAKVIMVQKPNKDHTNPKNYRPISLLPVLGKIYEGLICDRLIGFLEQNKILSKYQAGYRKGRSTQEHLFRLSQQVFNAFKEKKCTIAVFLDIEAAFDAVWTDGLKYKLSKLNLPSNFLRILCSFLDP